MIIHLTVPELAARWSVHTNTLSKWRTTGFGPPFIKLGRKRVLYPLSGVEQWERERLQANTVHQGGKQ